MRRLLSCAVALGLVLGCVALSTTPAAEAAPVPTRTDSPDAAAQISLSAPVDFATGAIPSSEAFNAASGDQLALQLAYATLSDSVAVGDFDHDGHADVAQTNVIAGTVSVFLGDGRGGFAAPELHPVGVNPTFVAAGDLDSDGHLDLAVANWGSDNLAILWGDGKGGFGRPSFVPVPAPRNVAIGNINGDDIPDLAVAIGGPAAGCPVSCAAFPEAGGVAILTGSRDPLGRVTFGIAQLIRHTHSANDQPAMARYVAMGDFDSSGLDDFAVAVGTNRNAGDAQTDSTEQTGDDLLVFLNRNRAAQQPFNATPDQPAIRIGASPEAIAVADWNADTHPDLAVAHGGSGDITTLLGDRRGRFAVKANNVTVGANPRSLAVGDLNGDGIGDLVTASFGASTVSVLEGNDDGRGNGDGTFQPAVDFWAGDAPTSVALGDFDGDRRLDVVAGRLRTDQLSLLRNDSPRPGDGVAITRDIPYQDPDGDPLAAHHTLDVYVPPSGTASFAGRGKPYPVVFFVHGGGGISGDKTMVSYLMRSLARDGIVAVSTNYRLGWDLAPGQLEDVAQAFRWTHDHVGSKDYGGDPDNIFVFAHSAGADASLKLATDPLHADAQTRIRGLTLVGSKPTLQDAERLEIPTLLVNGTQGLEVALLPLGAAFATAAGGGTSHEVVLDRDHLTIISDMALEDDEGRSHVLDFLQANLRR